MQSQISSVQNQITKLKTEEKESQSQTKDSPNNSDSEKSGVVVSGNLSRLIDANRSGDKSVIEQIKSKQEKEKNNTYTIY